jgi:hypothetical protein
MPDLQPLRDDHAEAVLAFEQANRLVKAGFVAVGPANPDRIGGNTGTCYQRKLDDGADR